MDISSMVAAVNGLKAASDIASGLINLRTMAEVQGKAIELNQKIIAAQGDIFAANAAQTALVQRIADLEKELTDVKAWESEKQRYKLVAPIHGALVYALQESVSNGEPPHYICPSCYQTGKKSILQNKKMSQSVIASMACSVCRAEIPTRARSWSAVYAEIVTPESLE